MDLKEKFPGVYIVNDHLATENLKPGRRVYGERLVDVEGKEYRMWDPYRSKLAASLLNGLKNFPFTEDSKVLYLGASSGTTPSHISDIAKNGLIYSVEFAPRMMRELVELCRVRKNMIPLLEDAAQPQRYMHMVEEVDVVYSDVAQPHQAELFMNNMRIFLKSNGIGIIMVKARSINVSRNPKEVFKEVESKLKKGGFQVLERIDLKPYEKDHITLVCEAAF